MNVTSMTNDFSAMALKDLETVADTIAKSRIFPAASTKERALTQLLIGQSLGLNLLQTLNDLVVSAKGIELKATVMASLIRKHPSYDYDILEMTDERCTIEFFRLDGATKTSLGKSSFGKADAAKAGLASKDTYQAYSLDMYFSRALSRGYKKYTPDAIGSAIYVPGEVEGNADVIPLHTVDREAESDDPEVQRATQLANEIRTLVGTAPKAIKKINDFLATLSETASLDTLESFNIETLEQIHQRLSEYKAQRAAKRTGNQPDAQQQPPERTADVSDRQKRRIENLGKRHGLVDEKLNAFIVSTVGDGHDLNNMTRGEASTVITRLERLPA